MDGTLYHSKVLDQRYEDSLYQIVADRKKISLAEGKAVFQAYHERLAARMKVRPSKLFTLNNMGISDRSWAACQGKAVRPGSVLKRDRKLQSLLAQLAPFFRLAIVTNNHRANTEETLACLGIGEYFDEVMTLSESRRFKPSPELYRDMAQRLGVAPEECLSIGDRYHLDLAPAAEVGMHTLLVQGMSDIYNMVHCLTPAQSEVMTVSGSRVHSRMAERVASVLSHGRLAVLPTDTVYGLSALPSAEAVRWIYRAKGRAAENPLVLLLANAAEASKYVVLNATAKALMAQHWPGGLTLVLPTRPRTPWGKITRGGRTLAVRVPDNPFMQDVIQRAGGALATTSANPSGDPAPVSAAALDSRILAFAHTVVDAGPCRVKVPSTVARVQGTRVTVLRPGAVQL